MRYFSLERHGDGRRAFVAASLEAFWAKYEALPAGHRHHYELIRADTPCRLYYDLEFCTEKAKPSFRVFRRRRLSSTGSRFSQRDSRG